MGEWVSEWMSEWVMEWVRLISINPNFDGNQIYLLTWAQENVK
jgi:hypothetical protein